jgi:hypothetical protein
VAGPSCWVISLAAQAGAGAVLEEEAAVGVPAGLAVSVAEVLAAAAAAEAGR